MFSTAAIPLALVLGCVSCTLVNDFDDLRGGAPGSGGDSNTTGTGNAENGGAGGGAGGGPLPNGEPCEAATECQSEVCAQGFCCDMSCSGECQQCDATGKEGSCSVRPAEAACGGGVCDGSGECASGQHRFSALFGAEGEERSRAVAFDPAGNVIIAGEFASDEIDFAPDSPDGELSHSPLKDRTLFVVKLSPDGELLDSTALGTAGADGFCCGDFVIADIATGLGGEIFLSARMRGQIQVGGQAPITSNEWAGLVMKLDAGLDYEWHHLYPGDELLDPQRIAIDGSGGVLVSGAYRNSVALNVGGNGCCGPGNAGVGTYVMRLGGSDGSLIASATSSATALGDVVAPGLAIAPSGDVVLAGHFTNSSMTFGSTIGNSGTEDAFIVRLEPDLAAGSASRFGDAQRQRIESAAMDPTGALWIAGSFDGQLNFFGSEVTASSAGTDNDLFVAKLDLDDAAALHVQRYGPFESSTPLDARIATDGRGNALLVARRGLGPVVFGEGALPAAEAGWIFAKLSAQGAPLWHAVFGATDVSGVPAMERHVLTDVAAGPSAVAFTGWTSGAVDYGGRSLSTAGEEDVVLAVFEP